jgi:hypothetical protein
MGMSQALVSIVLLVLVVATALALLDARRARSDIAALQAKFVKPRFIKALDTTLNPYADELHFNGDSITLTAADANVPLYVLSSVIAHANVAVVFPPAEDMQEGDEFTLWFPITNGIADDVFWFPVEDGNGNVQEGDAGGVDGSAWVVRAGGASTTVGRLVVVRQQNSRALKYVMLGGSRGNVYVSPP